MSRSSIQAPSSVLMIRPHHFTPNTLTARDNHFQTSGGADTARVARTALDEVTRAAESLRNAGVRVCGCIFSRTKARRHRILFFRTTGFRPIPAGMSPFIQCMRQTAALNGDRMCWRC